MEHKTFRQSKRFTSSERKKINPERSANILPKQGVSRWELTQEMLMDHPQGLK